MLVVVEDGDVERLLEAILDLKAARRGDVLEVDAAEAGRHQLDGAHDLLGVLGIEADREGVDARELLEQAALALHHRHRRRGADVAQAEHRGAVGDDGDGVALDRVLEGLVGVVADRDAHPRDARRVGHREVVARLQRVLVVLFDLAAHVQHEGAVGGVHDLHALQRLDRREDATPVFAVGCIDHDVAHAAGGVGLHEVHGADHSAGLADRGRHLADDAGCVVHADADRQAVLRAGGDAHGLSLSIDWDSRGARLAGLRRLRHPLGWGCHVIARGALAVVPGDVPNAVDGWAVAER